MASLDRWIIKVLCMFGMFISQCIFVLLPIKVSKTVEKYGKRGVFIINFLSCFGGGVFFGAYLTHLSPEVRASLEESLLDPHEFTYPIPEALAGFGFFLILFLEKAILFIRNRSLKKRACDTDRLDSVSTPINVCETSNKNLEYDVEAGKCDITSNGSHGMDPETSHNNNNMDMKVFEHLTDRGNNAAKTRSLIFAIALGLDSVLEGMAFGLVDNSLDVLNLFVAIVSHEIIMSFCIGMELVKHYPTKKVIWGGLIYAFTPTFGAIIGTVIQESRFALENQTTVDIVSGSLSAIAAGTFIYCSFVGILSEHLTKDEGFWKSLATLLGFSLMAGMAAIPEDSLGMGRT